jgi:hypothetical protein
MDPKHDDHMMDKAEHAHMEHGQDSHGEQHLDANAVEAALHGHDKKWETRTIRKIDVRLLIIRESARTFHETD